MAMYFYRVEWRDCLSPIDLNYASTPETATVFAHKLLQEHRDWNTRHSKQDSDPIEVWIWKEVLDDPDHEGGKIILKFNEAGEIIWQISKENDPEDSLSV